MNKSSSTRTRTPLKRTLAGEELYQSLRRHAQVGRPGEMISGERDLAITHGVCRVTVRKVIARLVEEGLLARHHGKGTFVAERALNGRWNHQIIFADDFPDLAHPYATSLLSGVLHQTEPGIRVQVVHFRGMLLDPANQSIVEDICRPETAGLILPELNQPTYAHLKAANPGLRIVHTMSGCNQLDVAGVSWDRFDCGMQAVNYLHDKGGRKLLFVHLASGKSAVMNGALFAAKAAGPELTIHEMSRDQDDQLTAKMILETAPDGLAFTDDFQARGVLKQLAALSPGYFARIPIIAVTNSGFDILPHEIARLEVNGYEVGTMAMATLKTLLGGGALPSANIGIKVQLTLPDSKY